MGNEIIDFDLFMGLGTNPEPSAFAGGSSADFCTSSEALGEGLNRFETKAFLPHCSLNKLHYSICISYL